MSDREPFEAAVKSANIAVSAVQDQIRQRKYAIDQEFSSALSAANAAVDHAAAELQKFDDDKAMAAAKPKYPVGTVVAEWERLSQWQAAPMKTVARTGVTGIVEIITRDSEHPANLSGCSRASVGNCVIRLLKKGGAKGAKYIVPRNGEHDSHSWKMWRPVGVDLNAELHAAEFARIEEGRRAEIAKQDAMRQSAVEVFGL